MAAAIYDVLAAGKVGTEWPKHQEGAYGGVIAFKDKGNQTWEMQEQMISSQINGISNGLLVNNFILIGSWVDNSIMICKYDSNAKYVPVSLVENHDWITICAVLIISIIWVGVF